MTAVSGAWEPVVPDIDSDGHALDSGDLVAEPVAPPVDEHLIPLPAPTLGQRWRAVTSGDRPPPVPAWVTDRVARRDAARRAARHAAWLAGVGGAQAPRAAVVGSWWTVRGAARGVWHLTRWVLDRDGHPVLGTHPVADDREYEARAAARAARQRFRASLLAVVASLLSVAWVVLAAWHRWAAAAVVVAVVVALARAGRPDGGHLVSPAVRRDERPRLTSQQIVAALRSLGITALTKALDGDTSRLWRSPIAAVRGGYEVRMQLPAGVLAAELVPHEDRLCSALYRPKDTVIVQPLPGVTPGDLRLYVLDRPVLSGRPAAWPLARKQRVSLFDPIPLGIDRVGDPYKLPLIEQNLFTGGIPGSGKSALVRVVAAAAALDPLASLTVINLKGTPDFLALQPICHRYLSGNPDTDRTIVPATLQVLAEVAADLGTRADLLTAAAKKGLAPDSKITADLAEHVPGLRPHVILIDEAHRLFDGAEDDATRAEDLLTRIVRLGRAHGVILCLATQLGDADSVPPALLRMASVRMCLRVSDHVALNQLLGNGASKSLGVPGDFTPGTGLVRTATGTTKIRSYYLDGRDLAEIGQRARAARDATGALTGDAAGDVLTVEQVDPTVLLRHVLDDMTSAAPSGPEDAGVAWLAELEAALTRRPEYAGRAAGWLTSELRARRVPTGAVNRRLPDPDGGGGTRQVNRAGVRGQDVRRALMRLLGDDEEGAA